MEVIAPVLRRKDMFQLADVGELLAGDELALALDRQVHLAFAPYAHGVEILQGQSQRVHAVMAGTTQRILGVQGECLAQAHVAAVRAIDEGAEMRGVELVVGDQLGLDGLAFRPAALGTEL